jgi:hypothetical protein
MFTVGRAEHFERFLPADVVDPVVDAHLFFCVGFAEAACCFSDHFFVGVGERAGLGGETFDDGIVAVR